MNTPRMPRRALPDPYRVEIILDSVNVAGVRLTTWALTYPRFVHAELNTHRTFSRNAASSRAIPNEKIRALVREHPALPIWWGKNQSGMQAREELSNSPVEHETDSCIVFSPSPKEQAQKLWLEARDVMLEYSERLANLGLHKQLCNRLTEVWMPITVLVSATSFSNWFHLRDHKDAQPELQVIATEMRYQYMESVPQLHHPGGWHRPFIRDEDIDYAERVSESSDNRQAVFDEVLNKISVGRCARVSYLTHDGRRDPQEDIKLHDKLKGTLGKDEPSHFSPFEHVALALDRKQRIGNFSGWQQLRKMFEHEAGPSEEPEPDHSYTTEDCRDDT